MVSTPRLKAANLQECKSNLKRFDVVTSLQVVRLCQLVHEIPTTICTCGADYAALPLDSSTSGGCNISRCFFPSDYFAIIGVGGRRTNYVGRYGLVAHSPEMSVGALCFPLNLFQSCDELHTLIVQAHPSSLSSAELQPWALQM